MCLDPFGPKPGFGSNSGQLHRKLTDVTPHGDPAQLFSLIIIIIMMIIIPRLSTAEAK